MTGLDQRIVLAPTDGSLGPLLRIADDRLDPGTGYGRHEHRDHVDVAVLRAGAGLTHDEVAGDDGVRVLQCYLRAAEPGAPPSHEVHRGADGWVDLRRPDARLWLARVRPGETVDVPPGLLVVRGADGVLVEQQAGRSVAEPGAVLVWQLDAGRPAWAIPETIMES